MNALREKERERDIFHIQYLYIRFFSLLIQTQFLINFVESFDSIVCFFLIFK